MFGENKKNKDRFTDAKLETIISQLTTIELKLNRFNQYLASANEISRQLNETIINHLALIKGIGEGLKEFNKCREEIERLTNKLK